MKKNFNRIVSLVLCICVAFSGMAYAHSGRLDGSGGHHDYNNVSGLGPYHYHCWGYPPHLHPGGVCPYRGGTVSTGGGNSGTSSVSKIQLKRPSASAKGHNNYIKISWTKVNHAEKYCIYRATSKNGKYSKIATTTGTTYNDYAAKSGKHYYYKIKAFGSGRYTKSYHSKYVSAECNATTLKAPAISSVKNVNDSHLKISWEKVSGASKYYVYRSTSKSGTFKKIATTKNLSYSDKTVKNKKTYYYKIRAISGDKKSKLSDYKSNKINFDGKITVSDNNFEMSVGEVKSIYVYTSGCDDDIAAYYDTDWIDIRWDGTESDAYELIISVDNESTEPINTAIELVFENHERLYTKTINITILGKTNIEDYHQFPGVPDFAYLSGTQYDSTLTENNLTGYFYKYSDIKSAGLEPENVIDAYCWYLEALGYKLSWKAPNEDGGYTSTYENENYSVGVYDGKGSSVPTIMIAIQKK